MRNFLCECGNTLYFANSFCLSCNRPVGFISGQLALSSCEVSYDNVWTANLDNQQYKPCKNYSEFHVCNWLIPITSDNAYCASCELTSHIPDLSKEENIELWYRMEVAKRRLIYTLKKLDLPVWRMKPDEPSLRFRFLEDETEDEYGNELTVKSTVITGHDNGVITLNLKEAEDASRVLMREKMNERYRTLIGHLRHESGHFYWNVLIQHTELLSAFRDLFGDERQDYTQSLESYYSLGPPDNWQENFISAYASMHPWEDWAETWAHYLHIVDTLETATEYQVSIMRHKMVNPLQDNLYAQSFDATYEDWCRLTTVLNALNRSMGLDDAYPFIISDKALQKLFFVHKIVSQQPY
ncbi:zinc-binding metallopeptidase family protein [Alteromonas sp. ASW11-130]|uniref:zinc-binding metallopeptidase family protein n=1 Tax=Alteromonas sp. ASW11-130 TaxID=3015775 RepID=UPI00224204C3|nr:putative zinc-binding metallopeptidase [Alteromonas sp. ASW11-130]MCW8092310.1 putative zinc-binding peptidase [Alteromonas sp. ASW11-130]